jgi:radical SAM protein with 4Fe4S-binding SPASM domain
MIQKTRDIFGFRDDEIRLAWKNNQLLSLEIEFGSRCNLRCVYCYAGGNLFRDNELELEEMFDIVSQAKALGARKIIYIGSGEPLLDNKISSVINYVHKIGLEHILFTNATLISSELAGFFYSKRLVVVVKYSSLCKETFDLLSSSPGSFEAMQRGLNYLFKAGYPNERHHLGIEAVISRQNLKEIPDLWRWARKKNILPYVECMTYKGSAIARHDLYPDKETIQLLFEKLSQIDLEEFGLYWNPYPPIAGFACRRHLYSCLVNSQGFVQPCVGIDIKVGNIRQQKLANIIKNSLVLQELSKIRDNIKGPCKECEYHLDCYGCRGTAYALTGDYLASDPTCWRIKNEASVDLSSSKK